MSVRAVLTAAVVGCLGGAALVLLAAAQGWATASVAGPPGQPAIAPAGGDLAPAVTGLALAALAGGLAIVAARGAIRVIVGAFLVIAGVGIVAATVSVVTDLDGALREPAVEAAGHTSPVVTGEQLTMWPAVTVAGGGLIAAVGVVTAARGRHWPGMSGRYERRDGDRAEQPASLWDALSRGDDPTG